MWTRIGNQKDWYDYRVANTPPWEVKFEGDPIEFPCLVSTETPSADLYRHFFIYEKDLEEMFSVIRGQNPVDLEVILAPALTVEDADHNNLDLLVDPEERRFMDNLIELFNRLKGERFPHALEVSEKSGLVLERGLEIMVRLMRRGYVGLGVSPLITSPAEQKLFSMLMQYSYQQKASVFSIGTIQKELGVPREFLATLLTSMAEKGMILCKNNSIL